MPDDHQDDEDNFDIVEVVETRLAGGCQSSFSRIRTRWCTYFAHVFQHQIVFVVYAQHRLAASDTATAIFPIIERLVLFENIALSSADYGVRLFYDFALYFYFDTSTPFQLRVVEF